MNRLTSAVASGLVRSETGKNDDSIWLTCPKKLFRPVWMRNLSLTR